MGCSTHRVPSWSKVAMRSSGARNCGLLLSVVVLTKPRIACFAGPSFQEGNGSESAVDDWPVEGVEGAGVVEQPTIVTMNRNSVKKNARRLFIPTPTVMADFLTAGESEAVIKNVPYFGTYRLAPARHSSRRCMAA